MYTISVFSGFCSTEGPLCSYQHHRGRGEDTTHPDCVLLPPLPSLPVLGSVQPSLLGLRAVWPCAPGAAGERRQLTPRKTCEGPHGWRGDKLDARGDLSVLCEPGACDPNCRHLEMAKGDRGGSPNLHVRCCCGQPDPPVGGPALLKVLLKGPPGVSFLVGEALCPALPNSCLRAFALDS